MTFPVTYELLSTNERAPSAQQQKKLNRADGFEVQETYFDKHVFPTWPLAISRTQVTTVIICHPRVLGKKQDAVDRIKLMTERKARVKLPYSKPLDMSDPADVLEFTAMLTQPWGRGTRKQQKNAGRPTKLEPPVGKDFEELRDMWFNPWSKENPNGYTIVQVLELAEKKCGGEVHRHHLKHWFAPSRKLKP